MKKYFVFKFVEIEGKMGGNPLVVLAFHRTSDAFQNESEAELEAQKQLNAEPHLSFTVMPVFSNE